MGVLGSGVAAGVAQSSAQAGQLARQLTGLSARVADDASRVRQFITAKRRGQGVEDEAELSSQGRVEEQGSQRQSNHDTHGREASTPREQPDGISEDGGDGKTADVPSTPGRTVADGDRLYYHLDIHA